MIQNDNIFYHNENKLHECPFFFIRKNILSNRFSLATSFFKTMLMDKEMDLAEFKKYEYIQNIS